MRSTQLRDKSNGGKMIRVRRDNQGQQAGFYSCTQTHRCTEGWSKEVSHELHTEEANARGESQRQVRKVQGDVFEIFWVRFTFLGPLGEGTNIFDFIFGLCMSKSFPGTISEVLRLDSD